MRQFKLNTAIYNNTKAASGRADDWSLLEATGDRIAHLFNTGEDDLIGAWRWRVWLDHKNHEGNGTQARETCERPWLTISKRRDSAAVGIIVSEAVQVKAVCDNWIITGMLDQHRYQMT